MRKIWVSAPLMLAMTACVQGCAITKALYVAIVHNSGAPPKAERARIAARETTMLRDLPRARVVVLPMQIVGRPTRFDTGGARLLADFLRAEGFANVTVADHGPTLPFEPQPNELLLYWTRFKALAESVAQSPPPNADYVITVDILGRPETGRIGAVHAMAVTAGGKMAYGRMWNSHQALYKEFQPRALVDAAAMVGADMTRRRPAP